MVVSLSDVNTDPAAGNCKDCYDDFGHAIDLTPDWHLYTLYWSQLTRPWLTAFGRYSYGLYLLHMPLQGLVGSYLYPVQRFLRIGNSQLPGQLIFYALCLTIFFIAAWLSWHGFEKHFLKLKRLFPMPRKALPPEVQCPSDTNPAPNVTPQPVA